MDTRQQAPPSNNLATGGNPNPNQMVNIDIFRQRFPSRS